MLWVSLLRSRFCPCFVLRRAFLRASLRVSRVFMLVGSCFWVAVLALFLLGALVLCSLLLLVVVFFVRFVVLGFPVFAVVVLAVVPSFVVFVVRSSSCFRAVPRSREDACAAQASGADNLMFIHARSTECISKRRVQQNQSIDCSRVRGNKVPAKRLQSD